MGGVTTPNRSTTQRNQGDYIMLAEAALGTAAAEAAKSSLSINWNVADHYREMAAVYATLAVARGA